MREKTKLFYLVGLFLTAYFVPWSHPVIRQSGRYRIPDYGRPDILQKFRPLQ